MEMPSRNRRLSNPVRAILKLARGGDYHQATFRVDGPWWSKGEANAGSVLAQLPEEFGTYLIGQLKPGKCTTIRFFDFGTKKRPARCLIGIGPRGGWYDLTGDLMKYGFPSLIDFAKQTTRRWSFHEGFGAVVSFIGTLILCACAAFVLFHIVENWGEWGKISVSNLVSAAAIAGFTIFVWLSARSSRNKAADIATKALAALRVH